MTGGRALVLGGAGAVGRHTARRLHALGHAVTIAGRTAAALEETARQLPGVGRIVADVRDLSALSEAGAVDVVVNTTGIASVDVVQPWLDRGAHVVDIAASGQEIRRLERADARNATLLLGVGLLPGLCTLMAAHLAGTDSRPTAITIGALLGVGEEYGDASRRWTISQLGRTVEAPDGTFRNFAVPVDIEFPGGFGTRRAYRFDFADQLILGRALGVPVTTAYCLDSRIATTALAVAARIPHAPQALLAANRFSRRAAHGSDWWAAAVRTESSRVWAVGRAQSVGTAMITALATDRVLTDPPQPGVRYLHEMITLDDIHDELPGMGIAVAHG